MKKYAALLLFAFLLNGCDDGDLTVDKIDFESVTAQSCDPTISTLIYKLKTQEALLLQLPEGALKNENAEYTYNIDSKGNGQYRVLYRAYDGTVASTNICGTIPPSTPKVTEEWLGTDGVIQITSKQIAPKNANDDGTRITGYDHTIIFKNITFDKPSGVQTQAEFIFGSYTSTVTPANLTFLNDTAYECSVMSGVYNYNLGAYLSIENIDPKLIVNTATPSNQPRTSLISATENKVYYRKAKINTGSFTDSNICVATKPATPIVEEIWEGELNGTIEVTTTVVGDVYTHSIVLKNVVLEKDGSSFELGSRFLLGNIEKK